MDAEYSPYHIRLFQTKSNKVKRGFPSASAKKGLESSHPAKGINIVSNSCQNNNNNNNKGQFDLTVRLDDLYC